AGARRGGERGPRLHQRGSVSRFVNGVRRMTCVMLPLATEESAEPGRAPTRLRCSVLAKLVGPEPSRREEVNGYWFWGLIALFVAVPEFLAAFSKEVRADIPWPTISNLIGKDL